MKRFAVFGAGGCGRGIMPLVRQRLQECESQQWDLVFVDDNPAATFVNGHPVLTYQQWMSADASSRHICVAIANGSVRERLATRCANDAVQFFDVRAPNVVIMDDVKIGPGALLSPFVTLTSNIKIGQHFHANIYSYVEHDCVIGDYVTFAPSVQCNGNVRVEDQVYIGTGAILRQGKPGHPLVIGKGAVVGMGAVVTRSVLPGTTVIGNPARLMLPSPETPEKI